MHTSLAVAQDNGRQPLPDSSTELTLLSAGPRAFGVTLKIDQPRRSRICRRSARPIDWRYDTSPEGDLANRIRARQQVVGEQTVSWWSYDANNRAAVRTLVGQCIGVPMTPHVSAASAALM